jgi:DNA-binding transcriptional LysR family regulator
VQHSFATAISLAAGRVGVLVVPKLSLPPGSQPELVTKPLVDPVVSRNLVIVQRRKASLSPAANEFLALLVKIGRAG